MEILGLSGYARSGKDEAAKVLVEEFGFRRVAFADKLREVLYALNPIVKGETVDHPLAGPLLTNYRLKWVIDKYGWNGYKETEFGEEIRALLQRLGTEAGRETLWDSIWVDAAFADVKPWEKIVVTDVRFPNEAKAIADRNGRLIRIIREGVGPANSHASETSLDTWPFDEIILNSSTLEFFKEGVRNMATSKEYLK
jgi:hypothetical protein